uniref:Uncharacterized protein n=1 Tax=Anopheles minimus TaxID=112268 RepID=A0A182WPC1_9DIPT
MDIKPNDEVNDRNAGERLDATVQGAVLARKNPRLPNFGANNSFYEHEIKNNSRGHDHCIEDVQKYQLERTVNGYIRKCFVAQRAVSSEEESPNSTDKNVPVCR